MTAVTRKKELPKFLAPEFLKTITRSPGVYLMKDGHDRVLYVGKARDLKKRLTSYARIEAGPSKTSVLLGHVQALDTIITNTEKEALILEASLIKKHKPRYNVLLRDDKSYPYIKLTINESWPRMVVTRRKIRDGARYFGPYSSSAAMRQTLNYLNSMFPLRRCRGKNIKKRERPCLNYQMGRCPAPCAGRVEQQAYLKTVNDVLLVLDGKKQHLVRELEKRMQAAAAALDFEEAARCRDRIKALAGTLEKQVVVSQHLKDVDVFGFVRQAAAVSISVILVRNGRVGGQRSFYLDGPMGSDAEIITEVLKRYYDEQTIPGEIILPFGPEDIELLSEWLSDIKGGPVYLKTPKSGDRLRLVTLARANAEQFAVEQDRKKRSWQELAATLRQNLGLSRLPNRIECLDISNIGGEQAVGSLVCFVNGGKEKKDFRHYKIRTVSGADDYAMMAEVLNRRLAKDDETRQLPDMLLLDGGKGHLKVGERILKELGLTSQIDLVSIAKGRAQPAEGDRLFRPGRKNPLKAARHSELLLYLMRIRDESHRFGIEFHRRWRNKKGLASELDRIPGIGAAKKEMLLQILGSMSKIKQATVAELAAVPGIGPRLAAVIFDYLQGEQDA